METLVRMEKRSIKARLKPDDTLINWISVLKAMMHQNHQQKQAGYFPRFFALKKSGKKFICALCAL